MDQIDFGHSPFEFTAHDSYFLIKLVGDLSLEQGREFERKIQKKIPEIKTHILLDLEKCEALHFYWFRVLGNLGHHTKDLSKKIHCFGMSTAVHHSVTEQGMDKLLQNSPDFKTALEILASG